MGESRASRSRRLVCGEVKFGKQKLQELECGVDGRPWR